MAGTLLIKSQILIRAFSEWNGQRPGFMEIDLVGHDGGSPGANLYRRLRLQTQNTLQEGFRVSTCI